MAFSYIIYEEIQYGHCHGGTVTRIWHFHTEFAGNKGGGAQNIKHKTRLRRALRLRKQCFGSGSGSGILGQCCSGSGSRSRCRPSWLTNSALLYESKCGGWGDGSCRVLVQLYTHRSLNKLWRSNFIFNL